MPATNPDAEKSQSPRLNDLDELKRFLAAYRPKALSPEVWALVSEPAGALVLRAGDPTRLRIEKDIQLLGAVATHLVERGRPINLDELLDDTTLLSFDISLRASDKTRENKRGIMRRLQAAHRGLPWRTERRVDGARVDSLVSRTQTDAMQRILARAQKHSSSDLDAAAFVATISAAREVRARKRTSMDIDTSTWSRARRFAAQHQWHLTHPILRSAVTHEVLDDSEPVAVLIARHGLTRRDLDLALTKTKSLPDAPSRDHQALLRGTATP